MTNLEKMKELVGSNATKEQIVNWAYMNRITVMELAFEEEFIWLENSVNHFIEEYDYHSKDDEHDAWNAFLDAGYVE